MLFTKLKIIHRSTHAAVKFMSRWILKLREQKERFFCPPFIDRDWQVGWVEERVDAILGPGLSADHHFMTWELGLLEGDRFGMLTARGMESYKWEPIWQV